MITFASFVAPPEDLHALERARHYRGVDDDDDDDDGDMDLDLDDDDEFTSGSKLTCPGETLTSSHAFMRYAPSEHPASVQKISPYTAVTAPMSITTRSSPLSQAPSSASTSSSRSALRALGRRRPSSFFSRRSDRKEHRYNPEVGDLVVGRITEVSKRPSAPMDHHWFMATRGHWTAMAISILSYRLHYMTRFRSPFYVI